MSERPATPALSTTEGHAPPGGPPGKAPVGGGKASVSPTDAASPADALPGGLPSARRLGPRALALPIWACDATPAARAAGRGGEAPPATVPAGAAPWPSREGSGHLPTPISWGGFFTAFSRLFHGFFTMSVFDFFTAFFVSLGDPCKLTWDVSLSAFSRLFCQFILGSPDVSLLGFSRLFCQFGVQKWGGRCQFDKLTKK